MAKLLKDLYSEEYVELLCVNLQKNYSDFKIEDFKSAIFDETWESKELKERMRRIALTLGHFLPKDFLKAVAVLKPAFSRMNFAYSLENMVFQDFVEVYGLEDFEASMDALAHFTDNSSSEFAIRAFILKRPERTMRQMKIWASSKNHHVRRLSSEGCRPRLPWAVALPAFKSDPKLVLEILELLKDDESPYVRKSVANNVNDVSKDNPDLAMGLSQRWIGANENRDALLKHGCRTLLKAGNREALNLFGFLQNETISLDDFQTPNEVKLGEDLEFSFAIKSQTPLGKLRIEFALYFLRKNGERNKKVFKISEGLFKEKEKRVRKIYSFKPISTRAYYKGSQKLAILINGEVFGQSEFTLF